MEQVARIYCLKSTKSNKVYVGSCRCSLPLRKAQHKYNFKRNQKNIKTPRTTSAKIFEEDENPEMVLIEFVDNIEEQRVREQFWIDKMKQGNFEVVNYNLAKRDYEIVKQRQKDKYHQDPEAQKKRCLEYYYRNKETILAKCKAKRQKVKDDLNKLKEIEGMVTTNVSEEH